MLPSREASAEGKTDQHGNPFCFGNLLLFSVLYYKVSWLPNGRENRDHTKDITISSLPGFATRHQVLTSVRTGREILTLCYEDSKELGTDLEWGSFISCLSSITGP